MVYEFTKDTGKLEHRRGGKMEISDKKRASSYLDLMEYITGNNRKYLSNLFGKQWKNTSSIEDVADYILHYND